MKYPEKRSGAVTLRLHVRSICRVLLLAAVMASSGSAWAGAPLLAEDFETPKENGAYARLLAHALLEVVEGEGVDGGRALKATYEGYERGSRRMVVRVPLPEQAEEMTLCYDVRFSEGFDFVRGGKLHGLGPERPVAGGNPVTPARWSARVNFGANGHVRTYLYVQDHPGQYGQSRGQQDFAFKENEYHAVSLHVKLNSPFDEANGFARVYVDGELLVDHSDVRFRGVTSDETLIANFLFSTFHGGSNPDWAPKTPEGEYATHHAYFDNIAVYPGKRVREAPGACWK